MIHMKAQRKTRSIDPVTTGCTFFDRGDLLTMRAARRERYWLHGDVITLFADAEDTHGSHCFFETKVLSPGLSCVRPHAHLLQDETTYVRSGRFEFTVADERLILGPGDLLHVPRGVVHTYRSVGTGPGRLWAAIAPAGLEGFFRSAGIPLSGQSGRGANCRAKWKIPPRMFKRYGIVTQA
jgi:quercetin dioxygenase-like cupin family protein